MSRIHEPPSVERYRALRAELATPLPARYNIAAAVCDRWAGDADRIGLLVPEDGGRARAVTFAELADRSSRLANAFEALGVSRGDRVAVCLGQSEEAAVAHLAIQRLGAVAVPVSVMAGSEAVTHRLLDAGARTAVADAATHGWVLDDDELRSLSWVMTGSAPAGAHRFEDLIREARGGVRPPVDTALDDPAIIIYTSGTSGLPKGALHAQRVVPAHTEPISLAHDRFPHGDDDVLWSPADWAWGGGLIDSLFAALQAGRPIVAWRPRGFDPVEVLDMLERLRVTTTFLPPTALRLVREAPDVGAHVPRLALRAIMTGGERCGEDLVAWCREALGLTPNEVYGQTEVSAVLGNSGTVLPVKPGSIGMEYPRVRAAVLDDDGNELPLGETGELALHRSTPAMFLGYWNGSDGPRPLAGEWHRTGDLGRRDADGYVWHEGRRDDLILSSGYRIGPGEVEEVIARNPAVRAVAVVGLPDERRGELVAAVLELRDGAPPREQLEAELRDAVRSQLAPYEVPRAFHVVDALPRTDTGKIRRAALRDRFGAGAS